MAARMKTVTIPSEIASTSYGRVLRPAFQEELASGQKEIWCLRVPRNVRLADLAGDALLPTFPGAKDGQVATKGFRLQYAAETAAPAPFAAAERLESTHRAGAGADADAAPQPQPTGWHVFVPKPTGEGYVPLPGTGPVRFLTVAKKPSTIERDAVAIVQAAANAAYVPRPQPAGLKQQFEPMGSTTTGAPLARFFAARPDLGENALPSVRLGMPVKRAASEFDPPPTAARKKTAASSTAAAVTKDSKVAKESKESKVTQTSKAASPSPKKATGKKA
ncbi:hypothetical protein CXG81DRAFT_17747 [Caulochytrium protostelioides]|uniref:Uncharacterized protein n=1 Tax=Caulochytrium protostelioides TaxID=1555241 RepID=A0A4P9XB42_9FUNG|nr:hypothetical protein CXG81DRAFT_17747 [Caulochytrium protostelioides]|eukprot:RKP02608.1 hypothetical protein CXG81DRAFT_17747 [Caulochytrium protostelioides]